MAHSLQVVFDCADPEPLARFWAEALGYKLEWEWDDDTVKWMRENGLPDAEFGARSAASDPDGVRPRMFFQRVPEGKVGKNRLHVDVKSGEAGLDAEVQRLVELGATVQVRYEGDFGPFHEVHFVMQDPEGNEFCVS
ncbi:MAG: hypothetical protein QOK43_854 [Acidimicrobiaceae bacterium]|nr:hypothetical protein [Acidimicrobiaceae bacterium]MDQ1446331.1 hypothetical protein [Acidimicrobiaceae bacterium]